MPDPIHSGLASGRWHTLSLSAQLGHVGGEVSRALLAQAAGNESRMMMALDRALELFDLTIADPRHRGRLREICRAREVVCDFFYGDNAYRSTGESLKHYFITFALATQLERGISEK